MTQLVGHELCVVSGLNPHTLCGQVPVPHGYLMP